MADFRQLALEFVLADEEGQRTSIAQNAAKELEAGPANSNPVARWVEAVQPWMPGSQGEEREDGSDTPDWTARAKSLEFLSRTLDFLGGEVLKPSQVKLLISFFGAMFEVDHKAGIMPSASALRRIVAMKSFQPSAGNDIIQKVCALKDDFPRQVAKTRLTIYELLRSLITRSEIISDLKRRHGADAAFVTDLIELCRSERDPDSLMVWFDILRIFLTQYETSALVQEEIYSAFRAYFPIALPRASQTGITPEELKLQLRKCFSANSQLAQYTFPSLLGKLDQGEGVTVNVKVDILKTIKACVEEYSNPEQAVVPFATKIWDSLKYEVRNGEIEDTIWGTLEVLKALTVRLEGDQLRDFALNVTRDCVSDLANTTYAAQAGRLLVSVMSAKPSAFVLMVSPAVTHIKDNLRRPKAPMHGQDLHKILHVILETRLLLVDSNMSVQDRTDFAAVDTIFKSLYEDVYKSVLQLGSKDDASDEDFKLATQAVQGVGALVCQKLSDTVKSSGDTTVAERLLSEAACSEICDGLFSISVKFASHEARSGTSDELVNETTKSLQRAIRSYTTGFEPIVDKSLGLIRNAWESTDTLAAAETITSVASHLAFVGCSQLPPTPLEGLRQFLYCITALIVELNKALDDRASIEIWCALAAAIQTTVRHFNDACSPANAQRDTPFEGVSWAQSITAKYPELSELNQADSPMQTGETGSAASLTEVRNDFLLISLYVVQHLYRRATTVAEDESVGKKLVLSGDFCGADTSAEYRYLYLISNLAGFVVHEMSEPQQTSIQAEKFALSLLHEDLDVQSWGWLAVDRLNVLHEDLDVQSWGWLAVDRLNVLSLSILEALRPSLVARLFDQGAAQSLIQGGCSFESSTPRDAYSKPSTLSILSILANKYKIEALEPVMTNLNKQAKLLSESAETEDSYRAEQFMSLYALSAGMLRRYTGKEAQSILDLLRDGPKDLKLGQLLGQRLEMLLAPQRCLSKENYAVVKPLWVQKIYFQLVKPMLQAATGGNPEIQDPAAKANFSIGVLLMTKHMDFTIYEDDADKILRISIAVAQQSDPVGPDAKASLDVLKNILIEAPEKGQDQLRSIIKICTASFSAKPSPGNLETQAGCSKLALEIVGAMPRIYESRYLLSGAPQVQRALTLACGHQVREVRKTARLARAAWVELK